MNVRMLQPADAESYWTLRLEALQKNPEAFATSYEEALQRVNPLEQIANRLKGDGDFTFGAFQNEKLVGVVTLLQEKTVKMNHKGYILAMYVTPHARSTGTGKALLTKAIEHAETMTQLEQLNLTVNASNEKAKKLYTSLGFEAYGIEKRALKIDDTYYDEEHRVLFLNR